MNARPKFPAPTASHILIWALGLSLLLPVVWTAFEWAVLQAVYTPALAKCLAAAGQGACWGVVAEKWKIMLFGRFPTDETWRAAAAVVLWSALMFITAMRRAKPLALLGLWLVFGTLGLLLMAGGVGGLQAVPTNQWGGLPLTLLIACGGFALAFPLGVLLALGRRSAFRPLAWLCTAYIELLRALPLVSILFLAAFVLPLLWKGAAVPWGLDLLPRVVLTIALFSAAYLAEVVRGGLQNVPAGQAQAARALGLNAVQVQVHIVLPQALRACLPSLLNSFITLFKECSLVSIVALFELTGALSLALAGDVQWRDFYWEGYLFIALVYWLYCFSLSKCVK